MNFVTLIEIEAGQDPMKQSIIRSKCTHVEDHFWVCGGSLEFCQEHDIVFENLGIGSVPDLEDLSREDRIKLCNYVFDVDIQLRK